MIIAEEAGTKLSEPTKLDAYLEISGTEEKSEASAKNAKNLLSVQDWQLEDVDLNAENFETNFYVREQYVLAHSNNVDIVTTDNFAGQNLLKGLNFYKVITKRQMPSMFKDILY